MSLLLKDDLNTNIRTYRLDQIIDDDDTIIDNAISTAESIIIDHLHQYYDTASIFSKTGSQRSQTVLNWAKAISIYIVYERVPDQSVPDRVVKNYDDTMELLGKIAEGKISLSLPPKTTTSGEVKTKFRGAGSLNRKLSL